MTHFEGKEIEPTTAKQFLKDVWPYITVVGLNGLISKMVYPALAIRVETPGIPYSWFVVSVVTLNNVSSLVGRIVTAYWDATIR